MKPPGIRPSVAMFKRINNPPPIKPPIPAILFICIAVFLFVCFLTNFGQAAAMTAFKLYNTRG
jgi:hypothetical protein